MTDNMKYRVNEIFYSLQGEGRWAGRAAVFVRFSGCNLKCPFCDTDFKAYREMTWNEIINAIKSLSADCRFVVFTGGEPTLQLTPFLVDCLHQEKYEVAIETNGTQIVPFNVDWITVSPKDTFVGKAGKPVILRADEIKIVFDGENEIQDYGIEAKHYYLQPCDTGNPEKNRDIVRQCVEYIKAHPKWQLSLQTQKIISVR